MGRSATLRFCPALYASLSLSCPPPERGPQQFRHGGNRPGFLGVAPTGPSLKMLDLGLLLIPLKSISAAAFPSVCVAASLSCLCPPARWLSVLQASASAACGPELKASCAPPVSFPGQRRRTFRSWNPHSALFFSRVFAPLLEFLPAR